MVENGAALLNWGSKLDALRAHFGPSWSWVEIAEWTLARGNSLPAWQVLWAREFVATRRWAAADDREAALMALDSGAEPLDRIRGGDDPCPADPRKRARDCYFCWHGEPHVIPPGRGPFTPKANFAPSGRVLEVKAAPPDATGLCVVCREVTTCNCAKCLAAKGGRVNTCGKCARAAAKGVA